MFMIIIGLWTNLEEVTLATPTFHTYGHSAECQVATLYYVISYFWEQEVILGARWCISESGWCDVGATH